MTILRRIVMRNERGVLAFLNLLFMHVRIEYSSPHFLIIIVIDTMGGGYSNGNPPLYFLIIIVMRAMGWGYSIKGNPVYSLSHHHSDGGHGWRDIQMETPLYSLPHHHSYGGHRWWDIQMETP